MTLAQNERTLFTFLSDTGRSTLPTFIRTNNANDDFLLITPDYLYDYFEPLFRKEPYTSDIKSLWKLTDAILRKVDDNPLHSSIIKTLSLIYMINQSEKLAPTIDVITSLFGLVTGEVSIVLAALTTLQEQKHVVYRKRSNHFLQLKSGANHDIYHKIKDDANRQKNDFELISALNEIVADNYLFPTQYNGEMAITRYFKFQFLNAASLSDIPALQQMLSSFDADGIVFGILLQPTSDIDIIQQQLMDISAENNRMVFILPKSTPDINEAVLEYRVISELYEQAQGDETLLAELDIYLDDLNELISAFIDSYQKPENKCSAFYAMGQKQAISRKAQLSNCLSDICTQIFTHTPVIKNETINQNLLTTASNKSRFKVLHALLSKQLEPQLGLAGSGQEVSFVRSLLLANGLIANLDSAPSIITRNTPNANIQHVLDIIDEFFQQAHLQELNFEQLYHQLIAPEKHIGLKRGVIPIFISLVAHQYKNTLIVKTNDTEFELSAPILQSINDNPSAFTASFSSWDTNKIAYVEKLEDAFQDHILESEKDYHSFSYLMRAMQHWYISLPQITKNLKNRYVGAEDPTPISTEQRQFMQALQQPAPNARKFLFEQLPTIFSFNEASEDTAIAISLVKHQMDEIKPCLLEKILDDLTELFADTMTAGTSLTSAVQDFIDSLSDRTKCHTFDGIYGKIMPVILENDSDSISFIEKIARATTGLRIDDWSEATIRKFATMIEKAKAEIYEYDCTSAHQSPDTSSSQYEIRFANNVHNLRSFNKVECSKMATLLQNELISALDEAGQSVSPEEKRQILIEIIERLC
ncbi:hypothetical protein RFF05_12700 [Bengtsoniella intestinalis]|uniref:hypothetical protein n=1 Tax=Bengtsoniella intestinalis TaxID=3073143 RepID=UPI00391F9C5E